MATAASPIDYSAKVLKEGLTCYICYDILREPKDLECPHVFCLPCLQEWVEKKLIIECPECRYITIVPQGGLGNLKTNLRLKTMAERYVQGVEKKKGVSVCPNHEGERQHFFCVTCCIMVCRNCPVLDHPRPQHDIKELKAITPQKAEIKRKTDQDVGEIKKTKKRKADTKLQGANEKANSHTEKCKQQGLSGLKAQGQNLTTLHETQNHTEGTINWLQNVVDTAADHNLMQSLVDQRGAQASTCQSKVPSMYMDSVQVNPGSSLENASQVAHVGAFKLPPCVIASTCQSEAPSLDMSDRVNPGSSLQNTLQVGHVGAYSKNIHKLKLISEFGSFQQASNVAATRSGLLAVADYEANYTDIYRKDNADFKRQYSLNITGPLGVAATSEGKLFISDYGRVKVFSTAARYETSWPESVRADRITTTPDDMIVIGSHLKGVISVHQSNGEMIRTHQLDCRYFGDIASNGKQIAFTTGSNGKVCVIDFVTGQTSWTLDTVRPLGICYEQKSNTLLVAGGSKTPGQSVIEQYCSITGRLISRLASGLYVPCAMTTTHDSKLVYQMKVYQMKFK